LGKDDFKAEFEAAYEKSLSDSITFGQRIMELIANRKWNKPIFLEKTGLNENIYSDMQKKDYVPDERTVWTSGVGLDADISTLDELLDCTGHGGKSVNRTQYAYRYVFMKHNWKTYHDFNDRLKELGVPEKHFLGTRKRKENAQ
jgi:hypothetical protein